MSVKRKKNNINPEVEKARRQKISDFYKNQSPEDKRKRADKISSTLKKQIADGTRPRQYVEWTPEMRKKRSRISKKIWKREGFRENISKKLKGRKQPEEEKLRRGASIKKWYEQNKDSPVLKLRSKRISRTNKGKKRSVESRVKQSESCKGRVISKETRKKISVANTGNLKLKRSLKKYFREGGPSEETRKKLSEATKKKWENPEYAKKCSKSGWKMHWTARRKISESMKVKNPMHNKKTRGKMANTKLNQYKDSVFKQNWYKRTQESPNKSEKVIIKILNRNKTGFVFVGDGKRWFTASNNLRFNPDFINENSKKIIEFFGTYWHKDRVERDTLRIKTYKRCGYNILVVQEGELGDIQKLEDRIKCFAKK